MKLSSATKCYLLLGLGCLQMCGDIVGSKTLQGLAAATGASPAPKVFSTVQGLETFSSKFYLEWQDGQTVRIGPVEYARVGGPYNRRNVYGAALAYGPVLRANPQTKVMFEQVSRYAFCADAPLLRELGIAALSYPLTIRTVPKIGTNLPSEMTTDYQERCE